MMLGRRHPLRRVVALSLLTSLVFLGLTSTAVYSVAATEELAVQPQPGPEGDPSCPWVIPIEEGQGCLLSLDEVSVNEVDFVPDPAFLGSSGTLPDWLGRQAVLGRFGG